LGAPLMNTHGEITLTEYRSRVGQVLGLSEWLEVSQRMIDQFADVTGDRQFIHVDALAAARTPFGTTIAHGFLTLSLLSHMSFSAVPRIAGARMSINYGMNSVRFITPVNSGARIRAKFRLKGCAERQPGQWQSVLEVSVEIEHAPKPALVAEWLSVSVI
jgi:acyl dehydratase